MAKKNNFKKSNGIIEPRVNDEIYGYDMVRVVYKNESENFSEVVTLSEARALAREKELDLIEINGKVSPPILRIADYSKYLFDLNKALKQKKKNNSNMVLKEVQLSTNISDHDLEIKAKRAEGFLKDGNKVKVVLTMRGRELTRRDISKKSLFVFIDKLSDVAIAENMPKDEGNRCIVILKKK